MQSLSHQPDADRNTSATSARSLGLFIRMSIALLAILASGMLAWNILFTPHAYAISYTQAATATNPWAITFDTAGHLWVAEPACDASPVCGTPPAGVIGEYSAASDTLVQNFHPPVNVIYNPVFLVVDNNGNVWFTDPTHNAIGELVPSTNTWTEWTAPTPNAAPYDLLLNGGNLWFTEIQGNKIGFFNTTSHTFVENAIPTAGANPYGITLAPNGHIWFTENGTNKLGEFSPTSSGTITITEHTIANPGPHLLIVDSQGNVWFTEGFLGQIGKLNPSTNQDTEYQVSIGVCPTATPGTTPTPCAGTHISGIQLDSNGNVWFDDSLDNRVGVLNPSTNTYQAISLITPTDANPHPHDGFLLDGQGNVWVSEQFGFMIDKIPTSLIAPSSTATPTTTSTTTPSPTSTPPPNPPVAPVNKTWYFAEGHVGKQFQEYLTLDNPDPVNSCAVSIQYLYTFDNTTALNKKTVNVTIPPTSRLTEPVNADLGIQPWQTPAADVSTIVTVNNTTTPACTGIVAERPMYFNYHNVLSGSDTLGATHLNTSFVFADVQTQAGSNSFINSYFTILNPPTGQAATVTASYYAGGHIVGTQSIQVPAGARRTLTPDPLNLPQHVIAVVTSTQPVVIERPSYFYNINEGNAGTISGAASVVGAQTTASDWLFAEGYTGGRFQEYLVLGNTGTSATNALIKLEYQGGHTQTLQVTVAAQSQYIVNVNQFYSHPSGTCDTTPCKLTPEVSAEIRSNAPIVAQRELFFQYQHSTLSTVGLTDVMGQSGPATFTAYSFAEGYSNRGYNEWLTLQNPTASNETITIKLMNGYGRTYTQTLSVAAQSRFTIDITALVLQYLVHSGDDHRGYEVSMTVSAATGSPFVAERPMYWNTSGGSFPTRGGSDILGYVGN
jgi:virginiamycin B lyase